MPKYLCTVNRQHTVNITFTKVIEGNSFIDTFDTANNSFDDDQESWKEEVIDYEISDSGIHMQRI